MLLGFFEGWRRSVSPEEHPELLRGSDHVVGFITGIGDGVLSAYIPLLRCFLTIAGRALGPSWSGACFTS